MIAGLLAASAVIVPMGYVLYDFLYPLIDNLFHLNKPLKNIVWRSVDASLLNAIKVTLVASAIVLLKRWWLKQKVKEKLEKEKINAELNLLKAQVHPAFLFSTLTNIIAHAKEASPKAPEMLIKLSDLLSYMLYECEAPKVKLEKEIGMLKEYIALEKIRLGQRVEMTFQINGVVTDQLISPLLLLPFIDYSFSYCNNSVMEQAWLNLDITVDDNDLSMKLINGIPASIEEQVEIDGHGLDKIKKRLSLLYPGKYELKINAEHELIMVHLKLKLEEATLDDQANTALPKTVMSYAGV
jgi:LytS/YehU family sensor histidine kinase